MYLSKLLPSDHFKFVLTRTYISTKWQIHNICSQKIYVRIPWQVTLDNKHCAHTCFTIQLMHYSHFKPPEDGREKRPKHVGVLYLQTRF
jgi:hypothetical protein